MALAMTLVIVSGGIDISVGGVFPLSAILMALMVRSGYNYYLAMLIVLLVAAMIGFINNELRRILKIHPMIVTMAMLLTLRGLNLAITDGRVISRLPLGFIEMANKRLMGLSWPMLAYIVLAMVWFVLSKKQRSFLHVYFVGGNPASAALSGIRTETVYRMVYMLSSMLASSRYTGHHGLQQPVPTSVKELKCGGDHRRRHWRSQFDQGRNRALKEPFALFWP